MRGVGHVEVDARDVCEVALEELVRLEQEVRAVVVAMRRPMVGFGLRGLDRLG
jgi:hypothetical protein